MLAQQNIEFDLTNLGNFLDFPLIDRVLRSAISDIVSALFVLPEKYFIKLCDDINISNLMYPLPKVNKSNYIQDFYCRILKMHALF